MATHVKTPRQQIREIEKLLSDAFDRLEQAFRALETLDKRLKAAEEDPQRTEEQR